MRAQAETCYASAHCNSGKQADVSFFITETFWRRLFRHSPTRMDRYTHAMSHVGCVAQSVPVLAAWIPPCLGFVLCETCPTSPTDRCPSKSDPVRPRRLAMSRSPRPHYRSEAYRPSRRSRLPPRRCRDTACTSLRLHVSAQWPPLAAPSNSPALLVAPVAALLSSTCS